MMLSDATTRALTMKTIKTITTTCTIGTRSVPNTFESVTVYSKDNPVRIAVAVDVRGFYTTDQMDSLIELLSEARNVAAQESLRLQHDSLFSTHEATNE
jgi:RNase adaptor protein for sRNA GlmZ degradation